MYALAPEEKATTVVAYTPTSLIRGDVVTRANARISIWLRMEGAPDFLRMHKVSILGISGAQARTTAYDEILVPATSLVGFHISPPASDQMDYDEKEANRTNVPISVLMGGFMIKGHIRISLQSDVATSISTSRVQWMSIYDAQITSPQIPQLPAFHIPMLIVRPMAVSFVLTV